MPPVKSKMFQFIDYDKGTLTVTFPGGKVYHHDNVPPETYARMQEADSKGRFYNLFIKPDHPHRKTE